MAMSTSYFALFKIDEVFILKVWHRHLKKLTFTHLNGVLYYHAGYRQLEHEENKKKMFVTHL